MRFADIIGQKEVHDHLISTAQSGRLPHAIMLYGPPGNGKFALALAYAQYLNCSERSPEDSCGRCPSCVKISKLAHPDVHFFFPTTTTKKVKKEPESKLFSEDWANYIAQCGGYPDINDWYDFMGVENKQGTLFVRDAFEINRKLALKPYESQFNIFIIWMPEKLHISAANKLLKNLEEPPSNTIFLLVAENPDQVLATIRSRCYPLKTPRISTNDLAEYLIATENLEHDNAIHLAILADGNLQVARNLARQPDEQKQKLEQFRMWMRLCFDHKYADLTDFAISTSALGRERIKQLLEYGLRIFRYVMLTQYGQSSLVNTIPEEKDFISRFAKALGPIDIAAVVNLFDESITHIERNVNSNILLSSLSLKLTGIIGRKK